MSESRLDAQGMASALRLAGETLCNPDCTTSHGAEQLAKALLDADDLLGTGERYRCDPEWAERMIERWTA